MPDLAVVTDDIKHLILEMRGQKVLLDRDLATLYGSTTKRLNQAVHRNIDRFPDDFMFQLTATERNSLFAQGSRFQRLKHARSLPFAFTEHGAIMAASVLNSPRAVEVSVLVVRAFVKLRALLVNHKELAKKFQELESRLANHDVAIHQLMQAIRQLMDQPPVPAKPKIGFR